MIKSIILLLLVLVGGCQTLENSENKAFREITSINHFSDEVARPDFKDTEPATEENLVGTWAYKVRIADSDFIETRTTYLPSGKWTSLGVAQVNRERLPLSSNGVWELDGEYLSIEVGQSSHPKILPIGFSSSSRVLGVSKEQVISISPINGKTGVSYRIE